MHARVPISGGFGRSDTATFTFGTKAETLARLAGRVTVGRLLPQIVVTVADVRADRAACVSRILAAMRGARLAVRSSVRGEDGWHESLAGVMLSCIDVEALPATLGAAIDEVIAAYPGNDGSNQVLVQPMLSEVVISGVALTRDLDSGSPYYAINYDDVTGRTDTVTGGMESKTLLVRRGHTASVKSARIARLLMVIREIEQVTGSDMLDIEFSITRGDEVFILQVRPLAAHRAWTRRPDETINSALEAVHQQVTRLLSSHPRLAGRSTILGDMPDWNPAEMIGTSPRPLAFSLYRQLISDRTWARARASMGYRPLRGVRLIHSIGGKPYVDVRASLNSFLPRGIGSKLATDVVERQLDHLKNNRDLHDKIEFRVAITCADFAIDERLVEMTFVGRARQRAAEFRAKAIGCTRHILATGGLEIDRCLEQLRLFAHVDETTRGLPPLRRAHRLLDAVERTGTYLFSILARHAFIAVAMLKSMVRREVLTAADAERFMHGVRTVAADIVDDMKRLNAGDIALEQFMHRYGHLRPGTYEITCFRYDERPELYFGQLAREARECESFEITSTMAVRADRLLKEFGYPLSASSLCDYIAKAIAAREEAKFMFTRAVSDALQALIVWGDSLGLSRDDVSFLEIADVEERDRGRLLESIAANRTRHAITCALRLPNLIAELSDIDVVRMPLGRPTFITSACVIGRPCLIEPNKLVDIDDRIVLAESADPGYDWIFSHRILGMITKYGGANSHMAIRCAEFGIPAAIGCGERMFNSLADKSVLELNCNSGTIQGSELGS